MIESVPNAVIVNESSVSFTLSSVISSRVYNVQYIIGRPANEQSFSSEHELPMLIPAPTITNIKKIRIKFFIISVIGRELNFLFYLIIVPFGGIT